MNELPSLCQIMITLTIINVVGGITLLFVDFKIIIGLNQTKFIVQLFFNKKFVHVLKLKLVPECKTNYISITNIISRKIIFKYFKDFA